MSKTKVKADELERLSALVEEQGRLIEEQRRRLELLEQAGPANGNGNGDGRHSRREILRIAGIAAAGAAGAVGASALSTLPAAAANSGTFTLGVANDADAVTSLTPTTTTPAGGADGSQLEIDAGKGGTVTAETPGYPTSAQTNNFWRAIHGISPSSTAAVSGVGVYGTSPDGAGVVGSSATGVDLWAFTSGRFMQTVQAAGSPAYQGGVYDSTIPAWTDFEIIRDANGIPWIYLPPMANDAPQAPGAPDTQGNPTNPAGNWLPLQLGGVGTATDSIHPNSRGVLFTAVSNSLMALYGSDGVTFKDIRGDAQNGAGDSAPQLVLSVTPAFNSQALITGSGDFYTTTANCKQDIGIYVSPSDPSNPPNNTQNIEAWKENGAGGVQYPVQPNAAFVQTVFHMKAGVTYTIKMMWKMNVAFPASTAIRAGAGPFGGTSLATNCSPTRLTCLLLVHG